MIPYEGKEPYIFISYAHKDSSRVLPIIEALAERGFRVWYDAGIEAGTEWPEYIATHLLGSSTVIAFLSQSFDDSKNCRREINYAIDKGKFTIAVHLEEFSMSPGMELQLGLSQSVFYYRFKEDAEFFEKILQTRGLELCKITEEFIVDEFRWTLVKYVGNSVHVTIPKDIEVIGAGAFAGCTCLESVTCHDGITEIHEHAFMNCTNLVSIDLPDTMTKIGHSAFKGCVNLAGIVIPEGIIELPESIFYDCTALTSVCLPTSLREIGMFAFSGAGMRSIIIPEGTEGICEYAFHFCSNLNNISLPKSLSWIVEGAFDDCNNLKTIYLFEDSVCVLDLADMVSSLPADIKFCFI